MLWLIRKGFRADHSVDRDSSLFSLNSGWFMDSSFNLGNRDRVRSYVRLRLLNRHRAQAVDAWVWSGVLGLREQCKSSAFRDSC
jgi:hypothetical protein